MYINSTPLDLTLTALRSGQRSLSRYIEEMNARIEAVNPHVQALLPEAGRLRRLLADAEALQERYPDPARRPRLFGALVGVKDIIHVAGFVTRAGTQVPAENFAGPEAECVGRLRAAGALIAGKTVTTEFAYFEPGPTHNPHNLLHTPGGSSSGSAAAVAAGLCTLALGTQTIGSVIRPAAFCGVVGFKPSFGRIPTAGIVYFSRSVDHIGFFTQDVASAAAAAQVLCDGWRPLPAPERLPVLGVPEGPYLEQAELEALGAFEYQLAQLEEAGYVVKRVPALADIAQLNQLHRRLVFAEFAQEHAQLFPRCKHLYRPRTAEIVAIGQTVGAEELAAARAHTVELRRELEALMEEAGIDLWITPAATGPAPVGLHATGDPNMNLPWTHAGMPALALPAGCAENDLPLGVQLAARFGHDEELLAWAQPLAEILGRLDA